MESAWGDVEVEEVRELPPEDGWRVVVGFARADESIVRPIAVLIVPEDPTNVPAGGLTQRKLGRLLKAIHSDLIAEVEYERRGVVLESPDEARALRRELRRLARQTGSRRGFGPDFYARVALDAIDIAAKEHDPLAVLAARYPRADPRPVDRRRRPITYEMVRGWVSVARHEWGFLPPTERGRAVFVRTEALDNHLAQVVKHQTLTVTPELPPATIEQRPAPNRRKKR